MLFVPLPLFATLFLVFLLGRFLLSRDLGLRAHQLFAGLLLLYAVQSLLTSLRWGYGIEGAARLMIILAPVLPSVAYLAYAALGGTRPQWPLWPLGIIAVSWLVFAVMPLWSDATILMTYIGFGMLILRLCWRGADHLTVSPINDSREILIAMCLTGTALVASGLTDVYVIYDFVQNEGRNAGLIVTFVQTAFVLAIGVSAVFGRASAAPDTPMSEPQTAPTATSEDADIVARLEVLFAQDGLHRNEDLSLRRLSRRLGLSDRQVSNAINRVRAQSVSQFVNDFRIKDACALLETSDMTILNASLAAGFATKSNFNREFLRVTGQSPSRWRQENGGAA